MEYLKLFGHFTIHVRDAANGRILRTLSNKNTLCVGARHAVVRLLTQRSRYATPPPPQDADYSNTRIWAMYVGTGTTAPTTNDTELEAVVFKKVCAQPIGVDLSTGLIEAQMTLETSEANGNVLTEVGVFTRGDNDDPNAPGISDVLMISRQVHGAIEKTSGISLEYTWRLQISV